MRLVAEALAKMDATSKKFDRLSALRKEANELIEQHIPQIYKDGDTRVIPRNVYRRCDEIMQEIKKLAPPAYGSLMDSKFAIMVYWGPHGELKLAPAPEEE